MDKALSRLDKKQWCGTGTVGTVTFGLSGTGTGTGTGTGIGTVLKWITK
jgi:hypothetical protein